MYTIKMGSHLPASLCELPNFERPSRIVLDIPIWLDTLVCQLLEKDPGKRPFDAATVGQALSNIQDKVEALASTMNERMGSVLAGTGPAAAAP